MTWHALRVVVVALVLALLFAFPAGAQLPGRQSTPTPDQVDDGGWITLGILQRHEDTGVLRLLPLATPTPDAPTNTPPPTATRTPTPSPTLTATPTATVSPEPPTPTPEAACVVRSTANVNARTLPLVSPQTVIGVLPADSPVRITGYYVEQASATVTYIWYRYWYDVEHPEAWSRADFFTARDESAACRLLPQVTEP